MTTQNTSTKFNHAEAFCLMQYKCKACGLTEMLYNSRDGVTPFIIRCVCCGGEAQHVNWSRDFRILNLRVFVNITEERAREIAEARLSHPACGVEPPVKGTPEYDKLVNSMTADIYKDGTTPDIVLLSKALSKDVT